MSWLSNKGNSDAGNSGAEPQMGRGCHCSVNGCECDTVQYFAKSKDPGRGGFTCSGCANGIHPGDTD